MRKWNCCACGESCETVYCSIACGVEGIKQGLPFAAYVAVFEEPAPSVIDFIEGIHHAAGGVLGGNW